MDATTGKTMSEQNKRFRAIQAQPKRPVIRFHSCCGGVMPDKTVKATATPRRVNPGQVPAKYRCTECGKAA